MPCHTIKKENISEPVNMAALDLAIDTAGGPDLIRGFAVDGGTAYVMMNVAAVDPPPPPNPIPGPGMSPEKQADG